MYAAFSQVRESAASSYRVRAACAVAAVLGLWPAAPLSAADARLARPNIVFILADDLGYGDLGCYGQTKIRTPNIDRLAAEGLRLTQHYAGNAVCAPSRCVLMTGKHPGHAHVRNNRSVGPEGQEPLPEGTATIPRLLQSAGYATGGFGKWGLGGPGTAGDPLKQGIDRWYGYNCQGVAHNFYPTYLWDDDRKIDLPNPAFSAHDTFRPGEDPADPQSYRRFQGTHYSADLIADQARAFIRDNKDRPFFCYFPTTVPHLALQVPDDSLQEYVGKWDDPPYQGGNGYLPHFTPRAAYAAMITRMDREVGRIMDLVQELGLDERTIFVFSSDNGPLNGVHAHLAGTDCEFFNSAGGLRNGKGTLYEGGIRVPGLVRWKGKITPGTVCDRVTGFEDWLPTLLDLAGLTERIPDNIDGVSFAATLRGNEQTARPFLYREFPAYGGQQCIRVGNWKAMRQNLLPNKAKLAKGLKPTLELYDIAADPREEHDVAAEHPDVVAKLSKMMREQHTPSREFPFAALD
jgi:arylsulfatase A-like enzyme